MPVLSGQTALVTGASRGIGAAIAAELAAKGAKVIGTATSESGCDSIRSALDEAGAAFVYDASESTAADQLVAAMNEAGLIPSIVVNNAAITRDTLLMRMSEDDWRAVLNTNLDAVFRLSRSLLRPMIKARSGRIINLTSIVGVMGMLAKRITRQPRLNHRFLQSDGSRGGIEGHYSRCCGPGIY